MGYSLRTLSSSRKGLKLLSPFFTYRSLIIKISSNALASSAVLCLRTSSLANNSFCSNNILFFIVPLSSVLFFKNIISQDLCGYCRKRGIIFQFFNFNYL